MARTNSDPQQSQARFGIGEWFGKSFIAMSAEERASAALDAMGNAQPLCPPRCYGGNVVPCTKKGGVCSLRMYVNDKGAVSPAQGARGALRTTCPNRFEESGAIFAWIGDVILGHSAPVIVSEIGFLEREGWDEPDNVGITSRDDVGRIDHAGLVHPDADILKWCALEIQAVYSFRTGHAQRDFNMIASYTGEGIPFPTHVRRPDYRSSGPKRLMPQLQIKFPSLRRWGKKMAVLLDQSFYEALGRMDDVGHVSNCDIAWFIVRYEEVGETVRLVPHEVKLTTLERAVEGLTAGRPVSLETFELRVRAKFKPGSSGSVTRPSRDPDRLAVPSGDRGVCSSWVLIAYPVRESGPDARRSDRNCRR